MPWSFARCTAHKLLLPGEKLKLDFIFQPAFSRNFMGEKNAIGRNCRRYILYKDAEFVVIFLNLLMPIDATICIKPVQFQNDLNLSSTSRQKHFFLCCK